MAVSWRPDQLDPPRPVSVPVMLFALFARAAHGAKNPKKCRGPCGPPAGVRPCASKERRGGFRIGRAQACGMESGMGAEASRHGMRSVGGCWAPVGLETTPRRERRRVPESRCRGPHRDGIPRAACGQYAHGIAVARWFSMRNGYGAAQHVRRKKEDSQ